MKDDDDVIDLTRYLERDAQPSDAGTERASFSVFGGDGDRSRFALPIWRSIYLVGGRRGALVWLDRGASRDPAVPDSSRGARPHAAVADPAGPRPLSDQPSWHQIGVAQPTAEFVLDLGSDPARTDFVLPNAVAADSCEPPAVLEEEDSVAVFLGTRDEKNWFLLIDDYAPDRAVTDYSRGDLLFLAGECAGLLFFRELAEAGDKLDRE